MAYTPSVIKGKSPVNNFGGLKSDSNRVAMTGILGNVMQTIDATSTPVVSPVTVATTQTIVVPQSAAQITIISAVNPVQVSEDSTQLAYFSLPAGLPWTFDVANQQNVYLKVSASTVVSFYFNMI